MNLSGRRKKKQANAESLKASWQFGVDVIERIPNLDPELFKLVLEERARTRPQAAKARPEQFYDESLVLELDREGFSRNYIRANSSN